MRGIRVCMKGMRDMTGIRDMKSVTRCKMQGVHEFWQIESRFTNFLNFFVVFYKYLLNNSLYFNIAWQTHSKHYGGFIFQGESTCVFILEIWLKNNPKSMKICQSTLNLQSLGKNQSNQSFNILIQIYVQNCLRSLKWFHCKLLQHYYSYVRVNMTSHQIAMSKPVKLFHILIHWWLTELPKQFKRGYAWMFEIILMDFGTF